MSKAQKAEYTAPSPHQESSLTLPELRAFVTHSSWTYAKTMPECPHEYTLRKKAADEALFERFVMHIRHHGYRARWKRSLHTHLDLDGWQYWTMGAPFSATILINRAKLETKGATPRPPAL